MSPAEMNLNSGRNCAYNGVICLILGVGHTPDGLLGYRLQDSSGDEHIVVPEAVQLELCFMCHSLVPEAPHWIHLKASPRVVCSQRCLLNYCDARDRV